MKKLLVMALAAFAVVSCAKDEVAGVANHADDNNAIKMVAAQRGNSSRATITTENLDYFRVLAYHRGIDMLIANECVNKGVSDDGVTTWTYSPVAYWPASGSVNFFAFSKMGINQEGFTCGRWTDLINDIYNGALFSFVGPSDVDENGVCKTLLPDAVYASAMNETQKETPVQLFFRHATSQVVFQYKHSDPAYKGVKVYVEDIRLANVAATGCYFLPQQTTTKDDASARGCWELGTPQFILDQGIEFISHTTYDANIVAQEVPFAEGEVIPYASVMAQTPYTETTGWNALAPVERVDDGYLNVLPQEVEANAWDKTVAGLGTGMHLLLKVKYTQGDSCLWPEIAEGQSVDEVEADWVAVPLNKPAVWEEGVRYIYTLGLPGGIDPETGEPVLRPIEFDLDSVNPWTDVTVE